jgi:hypothetical protein
VSHLTQLPVAAGAPCMEECGATNVEGMGRREAWGNSADALPPMGVVGTGAGVAAGAGVRMSVR